MPARLTNLELDLLRNLVNVAAGLQHTPVSSGRYPYHPHRCVALRRATPCRPIKGQAAAGGNNLGATSPTIHTRTSKRTRSNAPRCPTLPVVAWRPRPRRYTRHHPSPSRHGDETRRR